MVNGGTLVGLVAFGYKCGLRSDLRAPNFSMCMLMHTPSSVVPPESQVPSAASGYEEWLLLHHILAANVTHNYSYMLGNTTVERNAGMWLCTVYFTFTFIV